MYWTCSFVRIKWQLQLPPYKGAGIHEALSRTGLSMPLIPWNRLSHRTAKPTKCPVRQVKTQTNLGIHPVWSDQRNLGSVATHWLHSEDWSDWADAQTDLRLRCAHVSFCLFCLAPAKLLCFPVAQNQNRHFLRCLFPKLSLCPCSPHFLTSVPLFPK